MSKAKTSDLLVAGSVIVCSIVLFVALAMGLAGRTLAPEGRSVRVRFADVTGIKVSSQVKYAGAPAGAVSAVRMLTLEERKMDPANLVEVTLRLLATVPALVAGTKVSIASDTLLSDKFIALSEGPPGSAALSEQSILQGVAPTTFDTLVRNANGAIEGIQRTLGGGATNGAGDLIQRAESVLSDTEELLATLKPAVADIREAASTMKSLVEENREKIGETVTKFHAASADFESFTDRADRLVRDNEKQLTVTLADFKVTVENLKVTATYAKFLLNDLSERPSRLIWGGGKPPDLPSERKILESRKPVPVE